MVASQTYMHESRIMKIPTSPPEYRMHPEEPVLVV